MKLFKGIISATYIYNAIRVFVVYHDIERH